MNRTFLRNSQDLDTREKLRLRRRLAVTDRMCLSLADKESHGTNVRLDLLSLKLIPANKMTACAYRFLSGKVGTYFL